MNQYNCKFLIILFVISINFTQGQTYYNPNETVDINITIKEPFKPINFYEIGKDFNEMLNNEVEKRRLLKEYHTQIYYETKSKLSSEMILTNYFEIDNVILKLNSTINEEIDMNYRLLTNGMLDRFEFKKNLRDLYFNFNAANKQIVYIINYKNQFLNKLETKTEKDIFIEKLNKAINYLQSVKINNNKIYLNGVNQSNILNYISNVLIENDEPKNLKTNLKTTEDAVVFYDLLKDEVSLDYGIIKKGGNGIKKVKIENKLNYLVRLTSKTNCGCLLGVIDKKELKPGESTYMEVKYNTMKVGKINRNITLEINSGYEIKIIKVTGEIIN
tara:strand:- start:60 stop:1049 length:990 start_codon:yes stop_codon:yes gene_type:complete